MMELVAKYLIKIFFLGLLKIRGENVSREHTRRETGEWPWNTGEPVKYGRSGNPTLCDLEYEGHVSWHQRRPAEQVAAYPRMRLLDSSRTRADTTISLRFFGICIGFQFVEELFSSWQPLSTNVSMVCVHPTCPMTASLCLRLVVGSICVRPADWSCLSQEHELWHSVHGLLRWQARGFGILYPLL